MNAPARVGLVVVATLGILAIGAVGSVGFDYCNARSNYRASSAYISAALARGELTPEQRDDAEGWSHTLELAFGDTPAWSHAVCEAVPDALLEGEPYALLVRDLGGPDPLARPAAR